MNIDDMMRDYMYKYVQYTPQYITLYLMSINIIHISTGSILYAHVMFAERLRRITRGG